MSATDTLREWLRNEVGNILDCGELPATGSDTGPPLHLRSDAREAVQWHDLALGAIDNRSNVSGP
jgi:hypothetical protein